MNFRKQLLIAAAVLSLLAIWLTLGSFFSGSPEKKTSNKGGAVNASEPSKHRKSEKTKADVSELRKPSAKRELSQSGPASLDLDSSSRINDLIAQDSSHDETAAQLAAIACDQNVSEDERLEAIEHAADLGISHLLPLSHDSFLPAPLAEAYLHRLYRHINGREKVLGALGLLNHSEAEIREQAQILLGTLLKAEEDNESPEKLRQKADAFLQQPDLGDANEH